MLSLLRRQILWSVALFCVTLVIVCQAIDSDKLQKDRIQNNLELEDLSNQLQVKCVFEDIVTINAIADTSDEHDISERSKDDTKHAFILNLYEAISDEVGEMPNDSEVYISKRTHRLQLERGPPLLI
jgi:hypothetical protein